MSIFMNRRNVRTNKSNLMRLISNGYVDKRNVIKEGAYILFDAIPYAYAKRLLSKCDIEVENNNNWTFIRNMDYNKLVEFYKDDEKGNDLIINKEGSITLIPEEKTEDTNLEIKEETKINEITESKKDKDIEEIKEEQITEDEVEKNIIPEESILEASDEEKSELKEIEEKESDTTEEEHNFSQLKNINDFAFNKPNFKKKKKKQQ